MSKKDARDPYAAICISRLTRLVDLDILEDIQELEDAGNVMKNLELENQAKSNRSFLAKSTEKLNRIINRKHHHHQHPKIFGHPLTDEAVLRIVPIIDHLKSCVDVEGIFRVPGSKKRQEELKELIDKDDQVKLSKGKFTPHDIASVLKQFLAELPEPLLTHASHEAYIQVTEINNDHDNSKHIEALQILFLMIPPGNRTLLYYLLDLLHMISNSHESKMTPHNLAVVFSPTILYTKKTKMSCLSQFPEDLDAMNQTVAFMVTHGKELFKIPDILKKEINASKSNNSMGMVRQTGKVKARKTVRQDEDIPSMSHTFCQPMNYKKHRQVVQETTSEALVSLYNHVMDMPDGPVKQKFMEKFEKSHPGTPPFMPKSRCKASHLTSSTPLSTCSPASLARYPLSPINMDLTNTSTCKKVAFKSPQPPSSTSTKMGFHRFSPYIQDMKTPSGLISPYKTPQTRGSKARHRRTSTTGSLGISPFRRKRTKTGNTPDPMATPSGRIHMASRQTFDSPSEAVVTLYGTPTIRKRITSKDYMVNDLYLASSNNH